MGPRVGGGTDTCAEPQRRCLWFYLPLRAGLRLSCSARVVLEAGYEPGGDGGDVGIWGILLGVECGHSAEPYRHERRADDVGRDPTGEVAHCASVEDTEEGQEAEQAQWAEDGECDEGDVVPVAQRIAPAFACQGESNREVDCEGGPDGAADVIQEGGECGVNTGVEHGPGVGDEEGQGEEE